MLSSTAGVNKKRSASRCGALGSLALAQPIFDTVSAEELGAVSEVRKKYFQRSQLPPNQEYAVSLQHKHQQESQKRTKFRFAKPRSLPKKDRLQRYQNKEVANDSKIIQKTS